MQGLGGCTHGMRTKDEIVTMRDSRSQYKLGIGCRLEFNWLGRRCEGYKLALLLFVGDEHGAHPNGHPEDRVPNGRLIAPAFSGNSSVTRGNSSVLGL